MTDRFWGEGGSDGANGLTYATRKATIAATTQSPGDVIYQCAAAAGVIWVCTQQINVASGTAGNLVTYKVYPGHIIVMDVSTSGDGAAIQGSNKSYFRVEPGDGTLILGDYNDWDPDNWSDPGWTNYSARHQFFFANCNNFALVGTGNGVSATTNFTAFGGSAYEAHHFDPDCYLVLIQGIRFERHGTNNTGTYVDNPEADEADMLCIYGDRIYVYRCSLGLGGHQNIAIKSRRTIIDTCDFDGDWTGFTPNADAGRGAPIERSGQRPFAIVASDAVHGASAPYGPVLVQNCMMRNAGSAGDEHNNANAKVDGRHVIFRQNYVWDGCDAGILTATHDDFVDDSLGEIKVYNNTCYGNGRIADYRTAGGFVFDDVYIQCDLINNIFDQIKGAYFGGTIRQFRRHATGEAAEGFANGWKGARYSANIARMAATAPEGTSVSVEFRNFGGATEIYTWTSVDNTYPANWSSNNVMGTSPTYLGNPASGARTKATFTPNGGIETDAADPHAIANGAGVSTTTLVVDSGQARMFKDEWGMGSLGVEADWIKIGSGNPVQIASINYATDTITLTSARSWSDNAEIYWCTTDDDVNFTVFEDIGAGQTAVAVTPPDPPNHSTKVMVFR